MKLKKIPYYLLLLLLTIGASVIIGFLSFTGMYAIVPIIALALSCFVLSVAYDGEIYLQNIKGALAKLFKRNHLENELAKDYLLEQFTKEFYPIDPKAEDCPQFFKVYVAKLKQLHKYSHKNLDEKSQLDKTALEKSLKDMENWFSLQMFPKKPQNFKPTANEIQIGQWLDKQKRHQQAKDYLLEQIAYENEENLTEIVPQILKDYKTQHALFKVIDDNPIDVDTPTRKKEIAQKLYQIEKEFAIFIKSNTLDSIPNNSELGIWLNSHPVKEKESPLNERRAKYQQVKFWSVIAGACMSVGLSYLLIDALTILPFIAIPAAGLPFLIIPMAVIAGAAYTLLVYNAVTDMIHNNTIVKWFHTIRNDLKKGISVRNVSIAIFAVILFALNIILTVFTAGTWWTIVTGGQPIFLWMASNLPKYLIAFVTAVIIGGAQLLFDLQNTSDSFELIYNALTSPGSLFKKIPKQLLAAFDHLMATENWLQILNPFRLILKLTITPLRFIAFIGHLISIGVTADQVKNVPPLATAIPDTGIEGVIDLHYFAALLFHDHHHHDLKGMIKDRLGAGHGHDHSTDIPTYIIHLLASPVYILAASWDYLASRIIPYLTPKVHSLRDKLASITGWEAFAVDKRPESFSLVHITSEKDLSFEHFRENLQANNALLLFKNKLFYANQRTQKLQKIKISTENKDDYEAIKQHFIEGTKLANSYELELVASLTGRHGPLKPLSWNTSFDKQRGIPPKESVTIKATEANSAGKWQLDPMLYHIDKIIERLQEVRVGKKQAQAKIKGFLELRKDLSTMENLSEEAIKRIAREALNPIYSKQRFSFFEPESNTASQTFLQEKLPNRFNASAA
ncbi:MAG: hypothetical protein H0U70_11105 [Tatlockia sp.]|nr:hypothetical protein [Tatlockia sp.]